MQDIMIRRIGSNQFKEKYKLGNKLERMLFKSMLVLIPLTALVIAWSVAIHASADYLYHNYSEPFLASSGSSYIRPTHNKQLLTTQPLHIEYTVLKVPSVSKTAAKK